VYVDPERARPAYRQRVDAHIAGLRGMCADLGSGYHLLPTDQPLGNALFEFLQQRLRRGRRQRTNAPMAERRARA
jgi:hypothetical protein